jgi:hypothetical protein
MRIETETTEQRCDTRMAPELTPASRPYSLAMVNDPDPMGSALKSKAACDQSGGILKT